MINFSINSNLDVLPKMFTEDGEEECTDFVYMKNPDLRDGQTTVAQEYSMVCDKSYWVEYSGVAHFVGTFAGMVVTGIMADKIAKELSKIKF